MPIEKEWAETSQSRERYQKKRNRHQEKKMIGIKKKDNKHQKKLFGNRSSSPFILSLVPWSPGPLVPWSLGPLVLGSSGPLVLWSSCTLLLWSSGPLVPWCPGPLVLLLYRFILLLPLLLKHAVHTCSRYGGGAAPSPEPPPPSLILQESSKSSPKKR